MFNNILIATVSAMTVALIGMGIYLSHTIVNMEPHIIAEDFTVIDNVSVFNAVTFADVYMLLLIGVAIGVALITTIRGVFDV